MADEWKISIPKIFHDSPLRDSDNAEFHFEQYAATLAGLIASKKTRTPLTICVSGQWGSGKTTLLKRLRRELDKAGRSGSPENPIQSAFETEKFRKCRTVWFDAWKYSGEDSLLAALLRAIVQEMEASGFFNKIKSKLAGPKDKTTDGMGVILHALGQFTGKVLSPVAIGKELDLDLSKFREDTPLKAAAAFFDYFDDHMNRLLASWIENRIIPFGKPLNFIKTEEKGVMAVFIDDLDRCLPSKTVQVLEAIKLFLDKPGCVFVLGADLNVIRSAVESHYRNENITGKSGDYLEKIVQLNFRLPPVVTEELGQYLETGEAKEVVSADILRHWKTLVVGADINPRKVKTFINDLNLQWAMLENTGQAEGVNRDDFTKWQLLMRAADTGFINKLHDIGDPKMQMSFVKSVLDWAHGSEQSSAEVKEYIVTRAFYRILGIISFTENFTFRELESFIHLSRPPQPAATESVAKDLPGQPAVIKTTLKDQPGRLEEHFFGPISCVRIPGGDFLMGSKEDNPLASNEEMPQQTVGIPDDFWMARFPVTIRQYSKFKNNKENSELPDRNLEEILDHPVVNVSWQDAREYCGWLNETYKSELEGMVFRLPSEAEWEKAARGSYGKEWPWGEDFDPSFCNTSEGGEKGTTPVGKYSPKGDSPYGVSDMAGNVFEWCQSKYMRYPYKVDDGRESLEGGERRVVRGGCFFYAQGGARCASRSGYLDLRPANRSYSLGFRVVVSRA